MTNLWAISSDVEVYTKSESDNAIANASGGWFVITAWTTDTLVSMTDVDSVIWTSYQKVKEVTLDVEWIYTCKYNIKWQYWTTWKARIYINWVYQDWSEKTTTSENYITYTHDIKVNAWDNVQLYLTNSSSNYSGISNLLEISYTKLPVISWNITYTVLNN